MISWIFYFNLIVESFIGSIIVINNLESSNWYKYIYLYSNQESKIYAWLAIQYTLIALPIGMLFSTKLFRFNSKKEFSNFCNKNIHDKYTLNPIYYYTMLGLMLFSIICCIYVFYCIGYIPQLRLFTTKNSPTFIATLRSMLSKEFSGIKLIRSFAYTFTPIMTYVSFIYYKSKRDLINRIIFYLMFFTSILILTYNFSKGSVVYFFIGFIFVNVLLGEKYKIKQLFVLGIIISLIIISFYLSFMGSKNIMEALEHSASRLFTVQIAGTFATFELFPDKIQYLGWSTISHQLSNILNIKHSLPSTKLLMLKLRPEVKTLGVMVSLFIAEAYANWGLLGVIFSPIYVGFIIQSFFIICLKYPKTPLSISILAYFSYTNSISDTTIVNFIYSTDYIVYFIILIFICLFIEALNCICRKPQFHKHI